MSQDSILYFTFENQTLTHELDFITFAHMAARHSDLLPLGHQYQSLERNVLAQCRLQVLDVMLGAVPN